MEYQIDLIQQLRREILMPGIEASHVVVEVGAFYRPTVLPGEAAVMFADYYGTEDLENHAREQGIDRMVAPVSVKLARQELCDALGSRQVDWIVANHVLEHLVDPFRWIASLEPNVREGGRIFVTLPDKRFSFDRRRLDTTLAHFVSDFLLGGDRSLPEHCIDAGLLYDGAAVGGAVDDPSARLTDGFVRHAIASHHPGMHVHVFQGPTFRGRVLEPFLAMGWLGFDLEDYGEIPQLGEFYFTLRRTRPGSTSLRATPGEELFERSYDAAR